MDPTAPRRRPHYTWEECIAQYPRLTRAAMHAAILTTTEAGAAIRDYRDATPHGSEAVHHYGGPARVIAAAWKWRHHVQRYTDPAGYSARIIATYRAERPANLRAYAHWRQDQMDREQAAYHARDEAQHRAVIAQFDWRDAAAAYDRDATPAAYAALETAYARYTELSIAAQAAQAALDRERAAYATGRAAHFETPQQPQPAQLSLATGA